ncbi:hypothetical protein R0J91_13530, partial [Micrococcus sp. SIMBA_131]
LEGEISIVSREDLVDLASLSRKYLMKFTGSEDVYVTIELFADLANFSAEQLQLDQIEPGCEIKIYFDVLISDEEDCAEIEEDIRSIWGYRPTIHQTVSFPYAENQQDISLST